jgi:hypothetical protein
MTAFDCDSVYVLTTLKRVPSANGKEMVVERVVGWTCDIVVATAGPWLPLQVEQNYQYNQDSASALGELFSKREDEDQPLGKTTKASGEGVKEELENLLG